MEQNLLTDMQVQSLPGYNEGWSVKIVDIPLMRYNYESLHLLIFINVSE